MSLEQKLLKFIKEQKELNQDRPFLSDYENGIIEGKQDMLDDLERLMKQ